MRLSTDSDWQFAIKIWMTVAALAVVRASHARPAATTGNCPVTLPNGRGLPTEAPVPNLYGNDALSTALDIHRTTYAFEEGSSGPGIILPDGSLRWPKLAFCLPSGDSRSTDRRGSSAGRVSQPLRPSSSFSLSHFAPCVAAFRLV